ncbi:hypothetical protein MPER_11403 [Moniliophthora perniciosa FA553]|nr:hypothetical protein MPER_11403 [Moniliophthora perniciosa FA553]
MRFFWLLSLTAVAAFAAPTDSLTCDVSSIKVAGASLPAQKAPTEFIVYGRGAQKYICGDDRKYAHSSITTPLRDCLSPKWDFSVSTGDSKDFVVGARQAGISAPTGASDVDWLYLTNVQGTLASEIYRTNTKGGQPPASCTPGKALDVEYTALYSGG